MSKNLNACFSHKTDDWKTPTNIYNHYMKKGYIDPCPYKSKEDNLNKVYEGQNIFINPPFSQIDKWVQFIKNNLQSNKEIVLLIPARTDTKYFHELLLLKPMITFFKGRLKFNDTGCAPFPTILLHFHYYNFFTLYRTQDPKTLE